MRATDRLESTAVEGHREATAESAEQELRPRSVVNERGTTIPRKRIDQSLALALALGAALLMVSGDCHAAKKQKNHEYVVTVDEDVTTAALGFIDDGAEFFSWPDGGTTMFRNEKATQWEGGFRVPAAIRWPGVIEPGSFNLDLAMEAISKDASDK